MKRNLMEREASTERLSKGQKAQPQAPKFLDRPLSPLRTQFVGKDVASSGGAPKERGSVKNVRKTKQKITAGSEKSSFIGESKAGRGLTPIKQKMKMENKMISNILSTKSLKDGSDQKFEYFQTGQVPKTTKGQHQSSGSGQITSQAQKPPIAHAQSY